jgi:hypothetical protein
VSPPPDGRGDEPDGGTETHTGSCGLGPANVGPLACQPPFRDPPDLTTACTGLAAGATCTLGDDHHSVSGTCTVPSSGAAAVCVVACGSLGGPFNGCGGPDGGGGHGPGGGPGGGPGHGH